MHDSVIGYVQRAVEQIRSERGYETTAFGDRAPTHHPGYRDVLEVGSWDENGSVRGLFDADTYIGVDMRDGKGVDKVMDAHALQFPDASFDIVVSTEMLEHDAAPWLSMAEMGRVLRSGGHLIITARGNGFPLHSFPDDFWRFMPSSFPLLLELAGCEVVDVTGDPQHPGMFGLGRKR